MRYKKNIKEFNWKEISNVNPQSMVAVLPWGACEPHGEQLSYCTDTLLAEAMSEEIIDSLVGLGNKHCFMMLPPIGYGSQNSGQWNKPFCIHMTAETQKAMLFDIVRSLEMQNVCSLVIVNGHMGNNFKTIIRDLKLEFPNFNIYACNYLEAIDHEWIVSYLDKNAPEIDDHAGFTETSLMMHYYPEYVDMDNMPSEPDKYTKHSKHRYAWTPRNWDCYSCNTRIGDPRLAKKEFGGLMANEISTRIANELNEIFA